jgi:hypothetical protein
MYIAYRLDAVAGTSYSCTLTISGTGGTPSTTIVAIAQGVATGPIVQVGTAGGTYSAANTLLPVTMSSAPVNGNLLIGFAGGYRAVSYAGTYTSPLTNLNTTSNSVTFGYRYAGTSESTTQTQAQTNSATAAYYEAIVLEVSGLAPVNAFQNYATLVVTGASNVFTGASITPNMPGMLFAEFAFTDATGGITGASINSPWTLLGPYIQDGGAAYSTSDAAVTVYVAYMSVTSALVGVAQTPTMTVTGTPHSNVAGNVVASFASSAPFTRKAMFRQVTAGSRKGLTNAA